MADRSKIGEIIEQTYNKIVKEECSDEQYVRYMNDFVDSYTIMLLLNEKMYKEEAENLNLEIKGNDVIVKLGSNEILNERIDPGMLSRESNTTQSDINKTRYITEYALRVSRALYVLRQENKNVKSENDRGYYLSPENISLSDSVELAKNELRKEYKSEMELDEDYENPVDEHIRILSNKEAQYQLISHIIKFGNKKDPFKYKEAFMKEFLDEYEYLSEISYKNEEAVFDVIDGEFAQKYTDTDLLILNHPDILEKYNSLQFKYNNDGTLKEFEELVKLRKVEIEKIQNNQKLTSENKLELESQVRTAFARFEYEKLVNDNSKEEILDLQKRLGNKGMLDELNLINNEKINILSDSNKIDRKVIDLFAIGNTNSEIKLDEKYLDGLEDETKSRLKALISNLTVDIKNKTKDSEKIEHRYDFLVDIGNLIDDVKNNPVEEYTEEERKTADEKRKEKKEKIKNAAKKYPRNKKDRQKVIDAKKIEEEPDNTYPSEPGVPPAPNIGEGGKEIINKNEQTGQATTSSTNDKKNNEKERDNQEGDNNKTTEPNDPSNSPMTNSGNDSSKEKNKESNDSSPYELYEPGVPPAPNIGEGGEEKINKDEQTGQAAASSSNDKKNNEEERDNNKEVENNNTTEPNNPSISPETDSKEQYPNINEDVKEKSSEEKSKYDGDISYRDVRETIKELIRDRLVEIDSERDKYLEIFDRNMDKVYDEGKLNGEYADEFSKSFEEKVERKVNYMKEILKQQVKEIKQNATKEELERYLKIALEVANKKREITQKVEKVTLEDFKEVYEYAQALKKSKENPNIGG